MILVRVLTMTMILSIGIPTLVGAWGTGDCIDLNLLHVHKDMAYRVIEHPSIAWAMWWFRLNPDLVAFYAATEPQCYLGRHPGWTELRDQEHLGWGYPTEQLVGIIIHVASDAGVGSCHCPACEVFTHAWAEILFEITAEVRPVPLLTQPLEGPYAQRLDTFYTTQLSITNSYKTWFLENPRCQYFCDPWHWSKQGELNGMRLAQTALLLYFCHYADFIPDICAQLP